MKLPPKLQKVGSLHIDTSFDKDKYNAVTGTVIALPPRMPKDKVTKKIVTCDVRVGDKVWFHYLTLANAAKWHDSGCLQENSDDDRWASIPYDTIFFALRDEKMVMVNDWVLIEPIKVQSENVDGVNIDVKQTRRRGIVILNTSEYEKTHGIVHAAPDGTEISQGDIVFWDKESDVPLEYDLNQTMPTKLYRMKYADIFAKLEQ